MLSSVDAPGVRHPAFAAPGSATTWQSARWVWDPGLVMGSAPGDQQVGPAPGAVRDRRRELGAFLRSRRARLRPAEVGLADWGVRRVPGLRREEVAQLANVGLTWYTWLEQGRQAPGPPCPRGWPGYPPTLPGSGPAATWPAPSAGSSGSATPAPGR